MEKTRIIIADDQTLMRDGLKTILELEDDMDIVGIAEDGRQAHELVLELRPDLVLIDIQMPEVNGIEATKMIKRDFPNTIIMVLTTFDEDEYILEALRHGASGFLLKDIPGDKLIQAIRDCAKGQFMLPTNIAAKLVANIPQRVETGKIPIKSYNEYQEIFTQREEEIILYMLKGLTNKEIADKVYISEGTLRNYVSIIYSKIGINDRAKAILYLKKYFEMEI